MAESPQTIGRSSLWKSALIVAGYLAIVALFALEWYDAARHPTPFWPTRGQLWGPVGVVFFGLCTLVMAARIALVWLRWGGGRIVVEDGVLRSLPMPQRIPLQDITAIETPFWGQVLLRTADPNRSYGILSLDLVGSRSGLVERLRQVVAESRSAVH